MLRVFGVLFFVSGFCSLLYQVVWLRLAMAQFGVTTPMVSIVLSIFMAGLGLGSWLGGRVERRSARTALRTYAVAELIIASSCVIVPHLFGVGRSLLIRSGGELSWGSGTFYLASGAWIALVLLPFCTCMGATLPLAMRAIRSLAPRDSPLSFSYLYWANVLGALAGTLVSALVLIELLGFRGTLRVALPLNALLGLCALILSARMPREETGSAAMSAPTEPAVAAGGRRVLLLLFGTGLIGMGMEVVWVRQFTPYLGNVVYTFATVLALYLAATFLGSSAYRRWARNRGPEDAGALPRALWITSGLLALLALPAADPRFRIGPSALSAAIGIAPVCVAMGFLTPFLVDRWSRGDARRAGSAYAVNVVGCILGPLVAGFGLLPVMGERWALVALALPLFLFGGWASRDPNANGTRARSAFILAAALSCVLVAVFRDYETRFPQREVRRDYTATVIAIASGGKGLLVNGVGMTVLTPITKVMAHLPLAFGTRPPQDGLVICFGMGTSFRSMHTWGIRTTAVELVPSIPSLFGFYHPDAEALLRSPRARIVVDDGRRFLDRTTDAYDAIVIDPPPPVSAAGSSLLYSVEFYDSVKKRLRPSGILQQWLPGGEPLAEAAIAKALGQSFPHVRVFGSVSGWGWHFLASATVIPPASPEQLVARMPAEAVRDLVAWGPRTQPAKQLELVVSSEVPLSHLLARDPTATALRDDHPVNEYYVVRRTREAWNRARWRR